MFDRCFCHVGAILGSKGSQMEAKAPQRELKGCPKAAQRPPKGSKMDPTGSTHASVLASMGPKASRRTPWRQKGTKKLPKVRQKVTFSHQKLDAEAVPKTSKSRCKKGSKMKAKTFLNPYRPLLAFEQPPRFSVRACPCMYGSSGGGVRQVGFKNTPCKRHAHWGRIKVARFLELAVHNLVVQ